MDGRNAKKSKRGKHDFAFSGLIACHACGCAVVGEIKKERYVYYHCTGYADKCQGPASCRRRYVREEVLEKQFTELLGFLKFDERCWNGCAMRCTPAMSTSGASTMKPSSGTKPRTNAFRIAFTPCMSTSLTAFVRRDQPSIPRVPDDESQRR